METKDGIEAISADRDSLQSLADQLLHTQNELKQEIEQLKGQNNAFSVYNKKLKQEMTELKSINMQQIKVSNVEIQELQQQIKAFKASNYEKDKEIARLTEESKESRLELNELKRINSIDPNRYLEWNTEELVLWICGLDNGKFKKYKDRLIDAFKEQGVDGKGVEFLDKQELRGFGIDSFMDRGLIYKHIQGLSANNNIKIVNEDVPQQNEGQDGTDYMM